MRMHRMSSGSPTSPIASSGRGPFYRTYAGILSADRRQIESVPADDFEAGEAGLPQLVRSRGLALEGSRRLDKDGEGRARD